MGYTFLLSYKIENDEAREWLELGLSIVVKESEHQTEDNIHFVMFNSILSYRIIRGFLNGYCANLNNKNNRVALYDLETEECRKTIIVGNPVQEERFERMLIDTYPGRVFQRTLRNVEEKFKK